MTPLSIDLRRRVVDAYLSGKTSTYEETAELFGIGEATVSRLLSLYRSTGDVAPKKMGGNNPRKINLDWLVEHATKNPDARAVDRVRDWAEVSGVTVSLSCMYASLHAIGWSHKKKRLPPARGDGRMSNRSARYSF